MKFNSSCFSPFKWKYHHISTSELRTFHKEYVGFIRSFQFSSVSLNNINKTWSWANFEIEEVTSEQQMYR